MLHDSVSGVDYYLRGEIPPEFKPFTYIRKTFNDTNAAVFSTKELKVYCLCRKDFEALLARWNSILPFLYKYETK